MSPNPATMERLEDQIGWYDKKSMVSQHRYKILKVCSVAAAAAVPFVAGLGAISFVAELGVIPFVTGVLGVAIVVIEGIQQLNQYQQNWMSYRSTCEFLKHEKFLHAAVAGPYAKVEKPDRLLAERIESLISTEHAKWVSAHKEALDKLEKPKPEDGQ